MKILGLAGQAGAGKDHTFEYIRDLIDPLKATRIAFADGLKFDIEETLGLLHFDLELIRYKPYSPEIRSLLQWWGTELRREQYGDDYWVNKGMEMASDAWPHSDLIVITDVRFANEAEIVTAAGGMVAEVYASNSVRAIRMGGLVVPEHASEVIDFPVDARIDNGQDGHAPILPPAMLDYLATIN
jgi:hypothetical protein